ncbi:hypothetical protein [Flavobacterium sp. WC2509]|uniref:hypothetical protein n=1 Tax=Flavobacterium sp. WC2509 TaxID=3461406 RepID=UPI004044CE48
MTVTIPNLDNIYFKKLESILNTDYEPIEIICEIDNDQKTLDCFNIVRKKVENFGGKMILGWQIWQTNILMEAEAHAVWEDLEGELHDISPKSRNLPVKRIVFIEDSKMKYEGKQIQSIRVNITNNSVIDDYIKVSKLFFHLQNKGERANYYDLSEILNDNEIKEIGKAHNWKVQLQKFYEAGNNEKSLCFCGSLKNYKNCHRKELENIAKHIQN